MAGSGVGTFCSCCSLRGDRGGRGGGVAMGEGETATRSSQDVVIGDTTYPGGLDSLFNLNGNDLYVAGQIGSNEGIFSATSVVVGASTFDPRAIESNGAA